MTMEEANARRSPICQRAPPLCCSPFRHYHKMAGKPLVRRSKLLEREQLVAALSRVIEDEGARAGAVFIEGRPWTGRTELLARACALGTERGLAVLCARASLVSRWPWGVVSELFGGRAPDWSGEGSTPRGELRGGAVAALEKGSVVRRYRALDRLLEEMGAPVLVVVDDADDADAESVGWLRHLACRQGGPAVCLLLSMRPRLRGSALSPLDPVRSDPSSLVLQVRRLGPRSARELLRAECPVDLGEAVVAAAAEACSGYPLLLVGLARALGACPEVATMEAKEALAASVPRDMARLLLERISRLPHEASDLLGFLEAVAVLEPDAEVAACASLAGMSLSAAVPLAECLIDDGLLVGGTPLRYEAPVVALAVLDDMGPSRRSTHQLEAARQLSVAGAAPAVVVRHLAFAEGLARAARDIGGPGWLGWSPAALAEAILTLAGSSPEVGYPPALLTMMERAATALPAEQGSALVELRVAEAFFDRSPSRWAGALVAARQCCQNKQVNDHGGLRSVLLSVGQALGNATKARVACDALESAVVPSELSGGSRWAVWLRARAVWALARCGCPGRAEGLASLALTDTRRSQDQGAEFSLALAEALWAQGRLDEARSKLEPAINMTAAGTWAGLPMAQALLGGVLAEQGRLGEALEVVAEDTPTLLAPSLEALVLVEQRGLLLLQAGRPAEAMAAFSLARSWEADGLVLNPSMSTWRLGMAACLAAQGRVSGARLLAEEHLHLARAHGSARSLGEALVGLALLYPHGEQRLRLLSKAVSKFEQAQSPLRLAACLVEFGDEKLWRDRGTPEALEAFRRAADIGYRCNAARVVERAVDALRRAGARPRRLALFGPDSLTPAELRVASLAAEGYTNAEISSRLFLSRKTVEGHLVHAFRKLAITSRRELAGRLDASVSQKGRPRTSPHPQQLSQAQGQPS